MTPDEDYQHKVMARTLRAIMNWVLTHPDQKAAMKIVDGLPKALDKQIPLLKELGITSKETYEGLL